MQNKYAPDLVKQAIIDNDLEVVVDLLNQHPKYNHVIHRGPGDLSLLSAALKEGITIKDFQFIATHCKSSYCALLSAIIDSARIDVARFFVETEDIAQLQQKYPDACYNTYYCGYSAFLQSTYYMKDFALELAEKYVDILHPCKEYDLDQYWYDLWDKLTKNNCIDIIEYLIQKGLDINMLIQNNKTPLSIAISQIPCTINNPFHTVSYLIKNNANVNDRNYPIIFALFDNSITSEDMEYAYTHKDEWDTMFKKADIIQYVALFIHYGANPEILDNEGYDVYDAIESVMYFDLDKFLEEKYCDYDALSDEDEQEVIETKRKITFEEKRVEMTQILKDAFTEGVKQGYQIIEKNEKIIYDTMILVGQMKNKFYLPHNILNIILQYHGGFGEKLEKYHSSELGILFKKQQVLQNQLQIINDKQNDNDHIENIYAKYYINIIDVELAKAAEHSSILVGNPYTNEIMINDYESRLFDVQNSGYSEAVTILDEKREAQLEHYINTGTIFDTAAEILGQIPRLIYNAANCYCDSEIWDVVGITSEIDLYGI